ncbi:MAG: adenylate/guanylate cyclase domain-containing protein, partial [Spirochaetaceae bacterium]|nr:adenylate/guanylate cyclase domain-containing protein [Spirochaetaceae bacterium]
PDSLKNQDFEDIDLSVFFNSSEANDFIPKKETEVKLKNNGKEVFQKKVESYYIHQQLADALLIKGEIPMNPVESTVGIGFIDIANYSYLSKWLSPKENQLLLNGLYSAFTHVIKKKGGFLNKIEGDSLMFHFGGIIDPNINNMSENEISNYIAANLFYTCIEVQRACQLFNEASKLFLDENTSPETKESVEHAFFIISSLRDNLAMASGVDAKFQIKIRIGASIGEVSIGNFGPRGKKQWDIIGEPVIEARRMETTAPIGGLRISHKMYRILDQENIIRHYYEEFKSKAAKDNGEYKNIELNELFSFKEVILKKKNNVHFKSYSVQVSSDLPEQMAKMVISFLELGEEGADEILETIQYYRGNRLVMNAIERAFNDNHIILNKIELLKILSPKKYEKLKAKNESDFHRILMDHYSLYNIFRILGAYQDRIDISLKPMANMYNRENKDESYLERKKNEFINDFALYKKKMVYKAYFKKVVYPLILRSIKADILSFQKRAL